MRKQQSGFTLIEIAIVLVIIGLLLGGVLKGQELITAARVRNIISTRTVSRPPTSDSSIATVPCRAITPRPQPIFQAVVATCPNGNGNGQIATVVRSR